jgi:2,3-bisphosphoglycerate-dependent phosphoglycerate mutase
VGWVAIELVFETHSTTVDNEQGHATGWLPGQLSEQGKAQAQQLGRRRISDGITTVFSSDLARAAQTASVAFGVSVIPVLYDWRLRECDYGQRNGMPVAELHAGRREHLDRPYPGGESWRQAVARVGRFLGDLPLRWNGQRISSSVTSPPDGRWTTSLTASRWKISLTRTSPGRKGGSTGLASQSGCR